MDLEMSLLIRSVQTCDSGRDPLILAEQHTVRLWIKTVFLELNSSGLDKFMQLFP